MRCAGVARRAVAATLLPVALALLAGPLGGSTALAAEEDPWAEPRDAMLRKIEAYAPTLPKATGVEAFSPEVVAAMEAVPRHLFVPPAERERAYADRPLRIGYGQTISQPLIVALMTEMAQVGPGSRVLEIGTGSGYQAAVISLLADKVCSIEIIRELGEAAAGRLAELGYDKVEPRVGDGYFGWPECGPYDAILVTAAAGHVPPPLVEQLKPGGRMIIPVGAVYEPQHLTVIEKTQEGKLRTRQVLPVRFVPLTRGAE